jgi:hypothetical protein
MRRRWRGQEGTALPMALMTVLFFTLLVMTVLSLASTEVLISSNLARTIQARFCAEAGLEWALSELQNPSGDPWGTHPLDVNGTAICTFDVQKVDVSPVEILVTSTSTMASPQRGTAVQRATFDLDVTAGKWGVRRGSFRQD